MIELIHAAFAPVNLPATVLLLVVALYWVIFLFGLIDLEAFNIDFGKDISIGKDVNLNSEVSVDIDVDVDVDVDAEVDAGAEGDAETANEIGGFKAVLYFLNVGTMPFMIWLSFFAITFWMGSVLMNHYLPGIGMLSAFGLLIPLFLGTAFTTKLTTFPFRKLFTHMNMDAKPVELIGKLCTVTLSATPGHIGQADLWIDNSHIRVNVKTEKGGTVAKGEQALIYDHDNNGNIYLIEPFNH